MLHRIMIVQQFCVLTNLFRPLGWCQPAFYQPQISFKPYKTEIMDCIKLIVTVFNIHPFSVFGVILHITPFEFIGMAGTEF